MHASPVGAKTIAFIGNIFPIVKVQQNVKSQRKTTGLPRKKFQHKGVAFIFQNSVGML